MDAPPPQAVRDLIMDCQAERLDLVIGCKAKSQHTVWVNTDSNVRGKDLLGFLGTTNLDILNIACKQTLENAVREEVIDITL